MRSCRHHDSAQVLADASPVFEGVSSKQYLLNCLSDRLAGVDRLQAADVDCTLAQQSCPIDENGDARGVVETAPPRLSTTRGLHCTRNIS